MVEASQRAQEFDASVPNIARMYDYWLGGKDNFAADREAADRQARAIPQLPWLARQIAASSSGRWPSAPARE
jgi:hypothetical protein